MCEHPAPWSGSSDSRQTTCPALCVTCVTSKMCWPHIQVTVHMHSGILDTSETGGAEVGLLAAWNATSALSTETKPPLAFLGFSHHSNIFWACFSTQTRFSWICHEVIHNVCLVQCCIRSHDLFQWEKITLFSTISSETLLKNGLLHLSHSLTVAHRSKKVCSFVECLSRGLLNQLSWSDDADKDN